MLSLMLSACTASVPPEHLPNGHAWGCYNVSKNLPFCDTTLPISSRIDDLISRMTPDEKIGMMNHWNGSKVISCNMMDRGVPRLGIPPYMHLVEFNTAVASACIKEGQCSANFPGPMGLGASFNRSNWFEKGRILSDEFRAFNNFDWFRGTSDKPRSLIGLTGFGPNINMARDPRWGRVSEVPSEDPYLSGSYAVHYVRGGQTGVDPRFTKVAMGLKHYTAYTTENDRYAFIPNITMHDLWETFLPQFEMAAREEGGNASAVMCSYAGVNGQPSCGSDWLLNDILRGNMSSPDIVVASDCSAIDFLINPKNLTKNAQQAANYSVSGGVDLELGGMQWQNRQWGGNGGLHDTLVMDPSFINKINKSLKRTLKIRFKTGQFDPIDDQPYTKIPISIINSTEHQKANYDAAVQSFVLLKNVDETLPIDGSKMPKIAIIGPHINSTRDLMSDYLGDMICMGGSPTSGYDCVPTIERIFRERYPKSLLQVARGCDINSTATEGIAAAVNAAKESDIVFMFVGIGHQQEGEFIDRTEVTLPGQQLPLFSQISALNKKIITVLINGGAVSLGREVIEKSSAIVEAFYPSVRGAEALYDVLTGQHNSWGKMPVTVLSASDQYSFDIHDFNMSKGRTYKYFKGTPEWEFGFGLSYTNFSELKCDRNGASIRNIGSRGGDEVLTVYHSVSDSLRSNITSHPVPIKELVDFHRINIPVGGVGSVPPPPLPKSLQLVNENGLKELYKGEHHITYSNGIESCSVKVIV
eukprot:TRINITY_DN949_c0_g1_i1.p1 TRINITY_DN949_c0_g1~~TRINITY_DN949_c0_g1_i1.p1  ORF type:complete len:777 (+),score=134.73 TRINITY_DN949_c0_g1_i1:68-2332(+)